jgi:hypothetical protein
MSKTTEFGQNNTRNVTNFQKVLGKLDKMGVANLNKQQQRTLDSYFKSS